MRVAEHGDAVRADGVVRARVGGERGDGVADGVRAADDEEEATLDAVADEDVRGLEDGGAELTQQDVRAGGVELGDDLLDASRAAEEPVVAHRHVDELEARGPIRAALREGYGEGEGRRVREAAGNERVL